MQWRSMLGNHLGNLSDEGARPRNVDRHHRAMAGRVRRQPDVSHHAKAFGIGGYFLGVQRRRIVDSHSCKLAGAETKGRSLEEITRFWTQEKSVIAE